MELKLYKMMKIWLILSLPTHSLEKKIQSTLFVCYSVQCYVRDRSLEMFLLTLSVSIAKCRADVISSNQYLVIQYEKLQVDTLNIS